MKTIKQKLGSNSGASMLLALVFLLFCLLIGGSVLAAASANGSRAIRQKEDQQAYLSQRSAALLLADQLKGDGNTAMQLTIKKQVKDLGGSKTYDMIFMGHGTGNKNAVQLLVYNAVVQREYSEFSTELNKNGGGSRLDTQFVNLPNSISGLPVGSIEDNTKGTIVITEPVADPEATNGAMKTLTAYYTITDEGFFVTFKDPDDADSKSYVTLSMPCQKSTGKPVTVNGVTTTTTVIRWDEPAIEKGGA